MSDMNITPEEKNYLIELGKQIREIRQSKTWTQKTLGKQAGMRKNYIGEIERGERNIYFLTLVKIADALDCDVAAFTKGIPKE